MNFTCRCGAVVLVKIEMVEENRYQIITMHGTSGRHKATWSDADFKFSASYLARFILNGLSYRLRNQELDHCAKYLSSLSNSLRELP